MKRNFVIRIVVFSIIIALVVIGGAYYFIKTNGKKYEIEDVKQYNYFVLKEGEKSGVIDKQGNTIINAEYDDIKIPNPENDLFVCYQGENTKVLDSQSQERFTEFQNIEPIQLKNIAGNFIYEKTVLTYKKDGKFGLISTDGKKLTDAIYDSISGLAYREGELLISKDGKYGVINIKGNTLIKNIYDQIDVDGYYTADNKYKYSGYIVANKTNEGYRYGYINYKGKLIIDLECNQLSRVIDIQDNENAYLIAAKNGQFGIMKNDKQILPCEYQSINYDDGNDVFTIEKSKKYGITNREGKILVPTEYSQVDVKGIYIYAQNDQGTTVYGIDGSQVNIDKNIEILNTDNEKYKIKINNENGTQYGVIGKNGEEVIGLQYKYISYLYDNYFIVSKDDSKLGVVDDKNNVKIEINNDTLQKVEGTDLIETTSSDNMIRLYAKNMQKICEMSNENADIDVEDNYIKISNDVDTKYFSKDGQELKNTDIFTNNTLFAKKENDKWGFADKSGKMVVEAKYDYATEFNQYGYAGIKLGDKWGSIDENGKVVVEPKYTINETEPSFIKSYYQVKNAYGEIFYSNNE